MRPRWNISTVYMYKYTYLCVYLYIYYIVMDGLNLAPLSLFAAEGSPG